MRIRSIKTGEPGCGAVGLWRGCTERLLHHSSHRFSEWCTCFQDPGIQTCRRLLDPGFVVVTHEREFIFDFFLFATNLLRYATRGMLFDIASTVFWKK